MAGASLRDILLTPGEDARGMMNTLHNLRVWRSAMDLAEYAYRLCAKLPGAEKNNLISQIQRAAVSIPANIAEGYGKAGDPEFRRYLLIARGSLMELQTLILLAGRLGMVSKPELRVVWKQSESTGKMLSKLVVALKA